jgi:hypothetical protein
MVKLDVKNDMQAEFSGLAMVVRILVAMRNLLGDLWLVAAVSVSGGNNIGEV